MEFSLLRGLLLVALTARTLGDGECFQQQGQKSDAVGVSMFAS